jgi:thymidylate kinase
LRRIQVHLPRPDVTVLLDIPPDVSATRKTVDRDRFERDLVLLGRVRASYLEQARAAGWVQLDAGGDRGAIATRVYAAVAPLL